MEYRYTKNQVARGTRPDAETHDKIYLIKRTSALHATYQVRLLTYLAASTGRKLVIELPKGAKLHKDLRELKREHSSTIKVVRS